MSAADTDALLRAIDYLGAVEVAPGRYAYQDGGIWWTTSADAITLINVEGHRDHALRFLAMRRYGAHMPSWWTPERRYALRCNFCRQIDPIDAGIACTKCDFESQSVRITADLATGEERVGVSADREIVEEQR